MKKNKINRITIQAIRDTIDEHKRFRFNVSGVSMFPFLLDGDQVIIEKADPKDLRVGDIVMYIRKNLMIVHRIIKIYTNSEGRRLFIIKGDNLRYPDQPVWEEDIGGKATRVIRGELEFNAPSFHPIIISAVRFILDQGRRIKNKLDLKISQKDISEYLRRKR